MPQKPVIFLAFANDRVDDAAYLRNLPVELDGIRSALAKAVQAGLCEVVERSNLTIKQLLDVFQSPAYKDRIAIFHYGGHANGYQLLLEAHGGTHNAAHAEGLVSFFSKQNSLKLIFLNGCSSQQQALELIEAGIPSVIGTSQSINDDVATSLAIRFYTALAGGASIEKSWDEAVDEVKIQKGTANMRDLFFDGMDVLGANHDAGNEAQEPTSLPMGINALDQFPWEIYFKSGAEIIKAWNLPEEVENPLFGLPPIPPKFHLPETPFRYLQRYTRKEAEVLFGRSYYIRQLYNLVVDDKSAPLILLHGQSGVGKSSLIDAGFIPRLENTHIVWYMRRDQGVTVSELFRVAEGLKEELLGLDSQNEEDDHAPDQIQSEELNVQDFYGQLEALSANYQGKLPSELQELFERMKMELHASKNSYLKHAKATAAEAKLKSGDLTIERVNNMPLIDQWLLIEKVTGKPLVIIVDQLESIFTTPDPDEPDEFEEFAHDILEMFSNPEKLPQGKLILSYRKEYHPEIDEKFKQLQIPRSRLFLKHLERKDIAEVVTGLTSTHRTALKYKLEVEDELPIIIADDLLEDKESPIAPVLQILLTKMWQMSREDEGGKRRFTVDRYQELRQEGILMEDFYNQQMAVLENWEANCVSSGLALDVMMFHASSVMTADVRTKEELHQEYAENIQIIDELIQKMKELYLLSGVQVENRTLTTLAHDTLAPIVHQHYRTSDYPAQRARRILENRVESFDEDDINTALDLTDLTIVETGRFGMRALTDREEALVALSEKRRKRVLKAKKVRKRMAIIAVMLIGLAGVVAAYQAFRAERKAEEATIAKQQAEKAREKAEESEYVALLSEKVAKDQKSEADAQRKKAELAKEYAQEQAILARKSEKRAKKQEAIAKREKQAAEAAKIVAEKAKRDAEESAIAARRSESKARQSAREALIAQQEEEKQKERAQNLKNLAENKEIALKAAQLINNPYAREISGLLALKAYEDNIKYGGDSIDRDIYNALSNAWFKLHEGQDNLSTNLGEIEVFTYKKDRNWLVGGGTNSNLTIWKMQNGRLEELEQLRFDFDKASATRAIDISPKNKYMATGHDDQVIRLWKMDKNIGQKHPFQKKALELYGHKESIHSLHFITDHELISIDLGGRILCWNLSETTNKHLQEFRVGSRELKAVKHPNNHMILLGCEDGYVRSFNPKTGVVEIFYDRKFDKITSITVSPDGKLVAFGDRTGRLIILDYITRSPQLIPFSPHKSRITDVHFSPNATFLATTSYDRSMVMFRLKDLIPFKTNPKPIIQAKSRNWLHALAFMPDETKVIVGGSSRNIDIYDTDMNVLAQKIKSSLKQLITNLERENSVKTELKNEVRGREDDYYKEIMNILKS